MSGLVAGVEIGVASAVLGGVGEQVVCDVGLGGVSSLVVDDIELFSSVSAMLSVLPFSTPKKSGGFVRRPLPVRCLSSLSGS